MNELTRIIEKLETSEQLEAYEIILLGIVEAELNELRNIGSRAQKVLEVCENSQEHKAFTPLLKLILYGEK